MSRKSASSAKSKAYQTQCVSNLKQLQLGWIVYAGDFSDVLMPNSPSTGGQWTQLVRQCCG